MCHLGEVLNAEHLHILLLLLLLLYLPLDEWEAMSGGRGPRRLQGLKGFRFGYSRFPIKGILFAGDLEIERIFGMVGHVKLMSCL